MVKQNASGQYYHEPMYIEVFNKNFERVAVCDNYESLIWTDRYNEPGDFELYFGMNKDLLKIYVPDYYLVSPDSEYTMIIEDIKVTTDLEGGDHLIVTGRSLESILYRRIVWNQITVSGNFVNAIYKVLKQNVIEPKLAKRAIPEFYWNKDTTDESIKALRIDETQFTGDVVYEVLKRLCDQFDVGFSIKRNDETGKFVFKLYYGTDRSYKQSENPFVVFSPDFDNIVTSDYTEKKSGYCNVTLVAGEGKSNPNSENGSSSISTNEADRKTLEVGDVNSSGLDRRELYTDARDLSSKIEGDPEDADSNQSGQNEERTMSTEEYNNLLKNRGLEKLKEVEIEKTFDGQVEATQLYRYGEHFSMGDYCELVNQYGMETRVKIVEYIHSESTSGIEEYPTFKVVEEEEEGE